MISLDWHNFFFLTQGIIMHRFWENTILPSLDKLKPKHIIEIGSFNGDNTVKTLNYCLANDCRFTAIDPVPQFDYQTLEQQSNGKFKMITDLSLNAISQLDAFDVALIDGDHNWYTVYHELQKISEKLAKTQAFPVCFFHDTGWPYGRRDMYYDPSNIPTKYQQPMAKGGMFINSPELYKDIGCNPTLFNALREGGERNGVLTGIEDFVKDSKRNLTLYSFEGFNGFSILFENNKRNHKIFSPFEIQRNITKSLEQYVLRDFILA